MKFIKMIKKWINDGPLVTRDELKMCKSSECFAKQKMLPLVCKESIRSVKWNVQADKLASELSSLCDSIEEWELSVEKIIGRHPSTGMCTDRARKALQSYLQVRQKEINSIR
jgi:hypothetical protein